MGFEIKAFGRNWEFTWGPMWVRVPSAILLSYCVTPLPCSALLANPPPFCFCIFYGEPVFLHPKAPTSFIFSHALLFPLWLVVCLFKYSLQLLEESQPAMNDTCTPHFVICLLPNNPTSPLCSFPRIS